MLWSIAVSAMPCARAGYETIVDFSIPFWFIDPLRTRFPDIEYDYIVLRPSEAVCAARAAARPQWPIEDYSTFLEFSGDFDAPKPNRVCDDTADPATLAARIRQGLAGGRFRLPPVL